MTRRLVATGGLAGSLSLILVSLALGAVTRSSPPPESLVGKTVLLKARTQTADCTLGDLPDRRCSPGAYYSKLTKSVICDKDFRTDDVRFVAQTTKFDVTEEYGLGRMSYWPAVEIDHIISLELGGSNDIANLFPERANADPGYKVKDRLETKVARDWVCTGRMSLRTAQRRIAANWEALYVTVFGAAPPSG